MSSNLRLPWVDALRALAMLFVVFGHQAVWFDDFFLYTTPIKIPLFFAISGYLFKVRNGSQIEFYKNLFRKLVMPYFFLVTIPSLIFSFFYGFDSLITSWSKMISGETYWFMTCLIVAEVFFFYIRKYSMNILWAAVLCFTCLVIGLYLSRKGLLSYAKINTALICQTYLMIGVLYKMYEEKLNHLHVSIPVLMFMVYLTLCYISQYIFEDITFDCNLNQYYHIGYCLLLIFLGCLSCFMLVKKIETFPKWLTYIGQNTIILYLWAGLALLLFVILNKLGINMPEESLLINVIQTVWATIVCMGAAYIVNRYLPFILGKSRV